MRRTTDLAGERSAHRATTAADAASPPLSSPGGAPYDARSSYRGGGIQDRILFTLLAGLVVLNTLLVVLLLAS